MQFASRHKLAVFLAAALLAGGGYFVYKGLAGGEAETRYALAAVEKGTINTAVSGSGQVSASNQVEVKSKAGGDVVFVGAQTGQEVKADALLAQIDSREAQKSVRDAAANLESARLSLKKLKQPADSLSILQAENALAQAKRDLEDLQKPPDALALLQAENAVTAANEAKQKTEDSLKKTYEDGFNAVANAFLDFPTILTGLNDMFFSKTIDRNQMNIDWYGNQVWNPDNKIVRYKNDVYANYNAARLAYDNNFTDYKSTSRSSDSAALETIILETYDTAKLIADAVKTGNNYIDFVQDGLTQTGSTIPSGVTAHQTSLDSYTGKINSLLASLLSIKQSIADSKTAMIEDDRGIIEKSESLAKLKAGPEAGAIQAAQERIREKEGSLAKLKAGAEAIDIQSQQLAIKQKENSLRDAQEKLADYFIRAPFGGMVASVGIKKGDSLSSGGAIATLITKQRLAEISLNEVDVAKVRVGQKATLAFDAVPDLQLSGQAAEISSVGAVSQGVVSYAVKITFDTQDERIKPGMSVSANIITETKLDVLLVPNSAVKTQGEMSFVEMPADRDAAPPTSANPAGVVLAQPPRRQAVGIGLANDEFTEIISGLKEGDMIVTRTIQPDAQTTQTQQQSGGLKIPGLPGGGGGFRGGVR